MRFELIRNAFYFLCPMCREECNQDQSRSGLSYYNGQLVIVVWWEECMDVFWRQIAGRKQKTETIHSISLRFVISKVTFLFHYTQLQRICFAVSRYRHTQGVDKDIAFL